MSWTTCHAVRLSGARGAPDGVECAATSAPVTTASSQTASYHRRKGRNVRPVDLLGLRALYFVLQGALGKLVHLGYGLAAILGFIGVKLVLHWAHGVWDGVPEIPTPVSLAVIVVVLAVVTATSLYATRGAADADRAGSAHVAEPGARRHGAPAAPAGRADGAEAEARHS